MGKSKEVDCQNSPVVWFSMMELWANQGKFEQAAEAKRELERLGVFVRFKGKIQRQYKEAERTLAKRKPTVLRKRNVG